MLFRMFRRASGTANKPVLQNGLTLLLPRLFRMFRRASGTANITRSPERCHLAVAQIWRCRNIPQTDTFTYLVIPKTYLTWALFIRLKNKKLRAFGGVKQPVHAPHYFSKNTTTAMMFAALFHYIFAPTAG
jgi:hypothetical protein